MSQRDERIGEPSQTQQSSTGRMTQVKHGFVERFFRVTPTRNTAFITKLFSMVEDESIQDYICWSESGEHFTIFNKTDFSKFILPRYFKHGNWASFVRQLNMYDFRKVNESNNLKSNDVEHWDFKHPAFTRAGFNKLHKIRRKPPKGRLITDYGSSSAPFLSPERAEYTHESPVQDEIINPLNTPQPRNNTEQQSDSSLASSVIQYSTATPEQTMESEVLEQLRSKLYVLESKIESTNHAIHYLRNVVDKQSNMLTEVLEIVQRITNNKDPMELNNRPAKINHSWIDNQPHPHINTQHCGTSSSSNTGPPVKRRKKKQQT